MDLLQLQYILAIVESGSMAAAADNLHISQPALTQSYKKLEQELGVTLFQKQGRRLGLTPAGEVFCRKAQVVLDNVDQIYIAMDRIAAEQRQHIYIYSEAADFSDEAVLRYTHLHPEITLSHIRSSTEAVRTALASGTVPFIIAFSPDFGPETEAHLILEEPMYAVIGDQVPIPPTGPVPMELLQDLILISLPEGNGSDRMFQDFFKQADLSPQHVLHVNDPETITLQVGKGPRFSFIPESVVNTKMNPGAQAFYRANFRPVDREFCRRQVYLVTNKNVTIEKTIRRFMDFLMDFGWTVQQNHRYPREE